MIVTENFQSISLEKYLLNESNAFNKKDYILEQIFDGLDYLHQNLILHRDININNIIINPETFLVKIVDFGLARSLNEGDMDIIVSPQGNLKYRMPDKFEYSKNPYLYDIWGAGIVALSLCLNKKVSTKKFLKMMKTKENFTGNLHTLEKFQRLMERMSEEDNSKFCFEKKILLKIFHKEGEL